MHGYMWPINFSRRPEISGPQAEGRPFFLYRLGSALSVKRGENLDVPYDSSEGVTEKHLRPPGREFDLVAQ